MMPILYGLITVIACAIVYWIIQTIKATKNPDVQAASGLRMSITRYRLYQRIWDEYKEYVKDKDKGTLNHD